MENWFIFKVIHVGAPLVFPDRPLLSSTYVHFLLPHEGILKRVMLMADIQAMVAKGAVIPLPQDPGLGYIANLSWC